MTKSSIFMSLMAVVFASGCATLFRGTTQDLQVDSTPSGAMAQLSDGQSCTTPCTMRVSRGNAYNIKFSREGCETQVTLVSPHLAGSGVVEAILLGGIIDFADGAVYDEDPNPISSGLQCSLASAATAAPAVAAVPVPGLAPAVATAPAAAPPAVATFGAPVAAAPVASPAQPQPAIRPATTAASAPAPAARAVITAPAQPAPPVASPQVGDQWKSTDNPQ